MIPRQWTKEIIHNVQNILAACAMAIEIGIEPEYIKNALEKFEGVNRRFSFLSSFQQSLLG